MQTQTRITETLPSAALHLIARIERQLAQPERDFAAKVGKALGFRHGWTPDPLLGETATRITRWSQYELNAVYERVGGTVTTRPVQRSIDGGDTAWPATEITLTVDLPGIGTVRLYTDWDEPTGGRDLPVMATIADTALIAS
ncbi:hypothetical protein ACFQ0X_43965 [Streptomyces rectiviolaceus]|uniref:Uncharacterized protein n=1 Tax=Streptomyces rectiviolaceus TaxID=332591 RepID=A0ABP6NN51_9ACTN